MKPICIWIVVVTCLGFTSAWAQEQTFTSPLDKRVIVYGGTQFYQADGKFKNIKDGQPDISIDMDDLGLDETKLSPAVGAIINFWDRRLSLRFDYFGYHDDSNAKADFSFDWDDDLFDRRLLKI
ncbi:MAG: hypothetical protein V2I56_00640 [Desulfobacteraceae bacterium]|nr:hypothetical protein [Desulfobacteraceae bacterium]